MSFTAQRYSHLTVQQENVIPLLYFFLGNIAFKEKQESDRKHQDKHILTTIGTSV